MAANPRKFSEKIALHMQKQAEESAAFDQIMREVSETVKPAAPPGTSQHLNIISLNRNHIHGGSLPNVNQITQGEKGHSGRQLMSTSPRGSKNSIGPVRLKQSRPADHAPYNSPPSLSSSIPSGQSGGFSSGALPSFFHSHGTNYLSLPENAGCRRFNSDSALNNMLIPSTVPHSSEESSNNSNDPYDVYLNQNYSNKGSPNQLDSPGGRIIQGGSGDGTPGPYLDIPVNSSTLAGGGVSGSLPDLTNASYNFSSPIQQPLDLDDHQQYNHSPYSTSPVTYSPSNLSSAHNSPVGIGGGSNSQQLHQSQQPQVQMHQTSQQQSPRSPTGSIQINSASGVNKSFQQSFPQDNMMYRDPQRPSPQNSPNPYRSASPLDGQLSGPSSPSPGQPQNSNDYALNQQAYQLQQHFEQISVADRRRMGYMHQGANQFQHYDYYNQLQQGDNQSSQQPQTSPLQQPQTPQTPSSIPEIIFSEFLGSDFSDVQGLLREGLGPLDMDAFQLLNENDPNDPLQLDPQTEDTFRLDRQ